MSVPWSVAAMSVPKDLKSMSREFMNRALFKAQQ